ncbi:MAG TPA: hypothetical protein VFE60_01305 [Roseiarcus sp.]|nr:hypothetical protein [Roseiarcus sp.]
MFRQNQAFLFLAIERDRIAYIAFAASLNRTDGRNAAIRLKSSQMTDIWLAPNYG